VVAVELVVAALLLELLDEELLPHAANPALSAVTASSVVTFALTPLILLHRVPGIRCLLLLTYWIEKL
jgi:predicted lysophospholipase L1 biosynthesis ABC-type transport system permease subunit